MVESIFIRLPGRHNFKVDFNLFRSMIIGTLKNKLQSKEVIDIN